MMNETWNDNLNELWFNTMRDGIDAVNDSEDRIRTGWIDEVEEGGRDE